MDIVEKMNYFYLSEYFKECFQVIKQMASACEGVYSPAVLLTNEDYDEEE